MISSVLFKRLLILFVLGGTLLTLELTSENSLLMQLPSYEDVLDSLISAEEQEQTLPDPVENPIIGPSKRELQQLDYLDLFDDSIRHTFIIEFSQVEWDGLISDMETYNDMFGSYRSNNYRNVKVTYIDDFQTKVIEDVGFRSKGNTYSRRLPVDEYGNPREIHFMLKFNETFDLATDSFEYTALKTREVFDIEQLLFKWNNQWDSSYTNEIFSYEMFDQIGVPIPQASYAEVRIVINGVVKLVSFYNIFEQYDEEFVRKHLQEEPAKIVGDLYKAAWSANFAPIYNESLYGVRVWESNLRPLYSKETNKDDYDYTNLVLFTYGINDNNLTERKAFFEENFNVDNFLRAMAMNVLLGNPDDYRGNTNNFYFYFDENDYMTYIPFDYDNSMGSGWGGEPAFINFTLGNDIYEWGQFEWAPQDVLWDNLIYYEDYQIIYENYLMQFIEDGTYSIDSYNELYLTAKALYGSKFSMSSNKATYINAKINAVTEDVLYYRNLRNE